MTVADKVLASLRGGTRCVKQIAADCGTTPKNAYNVLRRTASARQVKPGHWVEIESPDRCFFTGRFRRKYA